MGHVVVIVEGLALALVAFTFTCACGTTVITSQPGHEWCVDVQGPQGSVSDPAELDLYITEPDTGTDPEGCLCFTAAEDQILDEGREAEALAQPLPAGSTRLFATSSSKPPACDARSSRSRTSLP